MDNPISIGRQSGKRVVVTGVGAIAGGAFDAETLWANLLAGRSSVSAIRRFDASEFPTRIAAEIADFRLREIADFPPGWESLDRNSQYAAVAAWQAMSDARLIADVPDRERVGLALAAGRGSYDHREIFGACSPAVAQDGTFDWEIFLREFVAQGQGRFAERRTPATLPTRIAQHFGFGGPMCTAMTACATGTQMIGDAARWIRMGLADVVLAGASDSELFPMGLASFCLLKALSTRNEDPERASRPFESDRDGFVIGEGAGVLVLEELQHALGRNARIYAEVCGVGTSSDSYRVTDPHPQGRGAALAMQRALDQAHADPSEVDYINAHGTSTPANDRIETLAIKQVFGAHARRIPISSTKSMIGHLTIAAGAVEAVACVLTLRDQQLHPTTNYEKPDPDCDLDYVPNQSRRARVRCVLSNSFGFGGQCAALLLRAMDSR